MEKIVINVPEDVKFICNKLENAGYEAWVVGGCVRDAILGKEPKDWDITTNAEYHEIENVLKNDVFIIPMEGSKEHNVCFTRYNHNQYEIATFRKDLEYSDHRHTSTEPVSNIDEDLMRRDFTINAMAYRPLKDDFKDLYNGIEDLNNKIIRAVRNPEDRINEDALRILRAYRFSANLGFKLDKNLEEVCNEKFDDIKYCSMERKRDEIIKTISKPVLNEVSADKLLDIIVNTENRDKNLYKFLDYAKSLDVKMALILSNETTKEVHNLLNLYKFDSKSIKSITNIIQNKDMFLQSKEDVKSFLFKQSKISDSPENNLYNILEYKASLSNGISNDYDVLRVYSLMNEIKKLKEPYKLKDLEINGNDLVERGYDGVEIGNKLEQLMKIVIKNPTYNQKDILLSMCNKEPEPMGDMF